MEEDDEELMVEADDERGREELARRIAEDGEREGVWDPRQNKGEDLECDPRAYTMLHTLNVEWPWLSFDVLPDDQGGGRTVFPHSIVTVSGSQAGSTGANKLTLARLDGLTKTKIDDMEDSVSDSDEEDDDDDEGPRATACEVGHPGPVRRVAAAPAERGLVATWSDDDSIVRFWDFRREARLYCADNATASVTNNKRPLATVASNAPGYALAWSSSRFASGDDNGTVLACNLQSGSVDVIARWQGPSSIEDLAWSPSEATVLMAVGVDKSIQVFDTRHKTAMLTRPDAHTDDINTLSWNSTVSYLVATGGDDQCRNQVLIWPCVTVLK